MTKRTLHLDILADRALYGVTSYAGIRSPDSEVVFETCDSLRHRHSFLRAGESSRKDSPAPAERVYSIFGPLQALACVPVLAAAEIVDRTHWFWAITPPRSHYVDGGIRPVLFNAPMAPADASPSREIHARRTLVAWLFNAVVAAAAVVAFLRLALRFSKHRVSALVLTSAYAGGSLSAP